MNVVWVVVGLGLIAVILWEVFNDLFHPAGTGALSDWVGRMLFDTCKRMPRMLPLAGPATLVTVVALWVAGLIVGFGLVYYQAYPSGFRTSTGEVPTDSSRLLASCYFSFETLITLGYGDIVPHAMGIRFVADTEGLVGFGLLTASVSWIVLLYPALSRMRLLARGVAHIVDAENQSGIALAGTGSDVALNSLARDVTRARIDFVHFPLVYYFASKEPKAAVPTWACALVRIAADARLPHRPEAVRFAANVLDLALYDLAAIVGARFVDTSSDDREEIFEALARDHLVRER